MRVHRHVHDRRGAAGWHRLQRPEQPALYADGSSLNGQYTVIGEVASGMNVVDKLNKGEPVPNPDKMLHVQVAADVKQ